MGRQYEVEALFWGAGAVTAHSIFTYNFYVPATLVLCGLVLARFDRLTQQPGGGFTVVLSRHLRGSVFGLIVVVLMIIPIWVLLSALLMSVNYERGVNALTEGRLEVAESELDRAARLYPHDATEIARSHLYLVAYDGNLDADRGQALLDRAAAHLEHADRLNPFSPSVPYTELLLAQRRHADDKSRLLPALAKNFAETLRRDRRYFPVRLEMAHYFRAHGQIDDALGVLEDGLNTLLPRDNRVLEYLELLRDLRSLKHDEQGVRAVEAEIKRMKIVLDRAS